MPQTAASNPRVEYEDVTLTPIVIRAQPQLVCIIRDTYIYLGIRVDDS